jgi:hypothetical protein
MKWANELLNRAFSKEKDSTSLMVEWLPSRTQTTNVGKREPSYTAEYKLVQQLWKTGWRLLKK